MKEQAGSRVPLLAGGAWMARAHTVERCRFAEKAGYDGILLIAPWYQVHTERELYAHFKAVCEAISIPIMVYNNPPVTGTRLSVGEKGDSHQKKVTVTISGEDGNNDATRFLAHPVQLRRFW